MELYVIGKKSSFTIKQTRQVWRKMVQNNKSPKNWCSVCEPIIITTGQPETSFILTTLLFIVVVKALVTPWDEPYLFILSMSCETPKDNLQLAPQLYAGHTSGAESQGLSL